MLDRYTLCRDPAPASPSTAAEPAASETFAHADHASAPNLSATRERSAEGIAAGRAPTMAIGCAMATRAVHRWNTATTTAAKAAGLPPESAATPRALLNGSASNPPGSPGEGSECQAAGFAGELAAWPARGCADAAAPVAVEPQRGAQRLPKRASFLPKVQDRSHRRHPPRRPPRQPNCQCSTHCHPPAIDKRPQTRQEGLSRLPEDRRRTGFFKLRADRQAGARRVAGARNLK